MGSSAGYGLVSYSQRYPANANLRGSLKKCILNMPTNRTQGIEIPIASVSLEACLKTLKYLVNKDQAFLDEMHTTCRLSYPSLRLSSFYLEK